MSNRRAVARRARAERRRAHRGVEGLERRMMLAVGNTDYAQNFDTMTANVDLPQYSADPFIYATPNDGATYVRATAAQAKSGPNSVLLHDSPGSISYYPQMIINGLGPANTSGYTSESVDISFDYYLPAVANQAEYFGEGLWIGLMNDTNFTLFGEVLIKGDGLFVKPGNSGGGYTGSVAGGAWHHVSMKYSGISGGNISFTTQLNSLTPVNANVSTQGQSFWNALRFEIRDNTGTHDAYIDNLVVKQSTGAGSGSISGTVFNDPNSNGVKDGPESGIGSWTVYLDANNNNTLDNGETSTTTNVSGEYTFSGLAAGTYNVKQQLKSGYRKTLPGTGVPGHTVAVAGSAVTGKDFGNTTNILLAGTVYNDKNGNGTQDAGENALGGVTVNIVSNATIVATRVTDADGKWQVRGLAAGSGQAEVVAPAGYTKVAPAGGAYNGSMSNGQQNANLNFALRQTGAAPAAFSAASILAATIDSLIDDLV